MSNSDYLVLGIKGYDFTKDDGDRVAGVNVFYLDMMMGDYDSNVKGYMPLKTSCTPKVLEQLTVVPGFYDLDFRQKPGANGKASLVLANAEFVGNVNWLSEKKDLKAV